MAPQSSSESLNEANHVSSSQQHDHQHIHKLSQRPNLRLNTTIATKHKTAHALGTPNQSSPRTPAYDMPTFAYPPPYDEACQQLWARGSRAVQQPDGTVNQLDVLNWILRQKGGAHADWPMLREAEQQIEQLRKQTYDLPAMRQQVIDEYEEYMRREERRQAARRRLLAQSKRTREKQDR
jgi:hypothetical protein